MSGASHFTPRFLTAQEYVFALHEPSDQVAVLVRNRTRAPNHPANSSCRRNRERSVSVLASRAEPVWSRHFHRNESSKRRGAKPDQRTNPRNTPHVSRPRRGSRRFASGHPYFRRRATTELRSRHFARKTSSRLARRRLRHKLRRNRCCVPWPRSMAAIRRPPTFPGFFVCPDSRTGNTTRPLLCASITNPTPFTICKTFTSTKIRRNLRKISRNHSAARAGCPPVTAASRKQTGLTRNEPWPAGMILKLSFNASPSIAPTKKATRFTTLGTPSQRHRLNSCDSALPVSLPKRMKHPRGNPA